MKKINWKILNLAFWTEIILSYVLPFSTADQFQYTVGFPMPFLTVYSGKINVNPMLSTHLNLLGLLLNAVLLYLLFSLALSLYGRIKTKYRGKK